MAIDYTNFYTVYYWMSKLKIKKVVKEFVGSGVDKVKGALGFAYGKDRVPYDNYPAILHAGEKVLTRNQADQYERQMSTRGVQLKDVTPLDRDSSGDNSNTQVQTVQGGDAGNSKSGNWSINIGDITFPNAQMGSERDVKATADELVTEIVARLTKLRWRMRMLLRVLELILHLEMIILL